MTVYAILCKYGLLFQMPEEQAFDTMQYLMFNQGFRRQYRPDMVALQVG